MGLLLRTLAHAQRSSVEPATRSDPNARHSRGTDAPSGGAGATAGAGRNRCDARARDRRGAFDGRRRHRPVPRPSGHLRGASVVLAELRIDAANARLAGSGPEERRGCSSADVEPRFRARGDLAHGRCDQERSLHAEASQRTSPTGSNAGSILSATRSNSSTRRTALESRTAPRCTSWLGFWSRWPRVRVPSLTPPERLHKPGRIVTVTASDASRVTDSIRPRSSRLDHSGSISSR